MGAGCAETCTSGSERARGCNSPALLASGIKRTNLNFGSSDFGVLAVYRRCASLDFQGIAPVSDEPCPGTKLMITWSCLEKRSWPVRGRNPTRDIQADGAPMVHRAPDERFRQGPLCFDPHRTPEPCLKKIQKSTLFPDDPFFINVMPRQIVSKWRKRFFEKRLAGLRDQPRRGGGHVHVHRSGWSGDGRDSGVIPGRRPDRLIECRRARVGLS